jgi:phage FluMu protein Com
VENTDIIKVKCPNCEKLHGISLNAFEHGREIKFKCEYDSSCISVSFDKNGGLIVKPANDQDFNFKR